MRMKIVPYTREDLVRLANPQMANQPQVIPHILYDTQTYVSAATTKLTFFQTVQSDKTLGNIEAPGSLPSPQFFAIESIGCDILTQVTTAAGGVPGAINDVQLLSLIGRATLTLSYQNKDYGPWPLSAFGASGGATGFGWGTFTAEESLQYANHGIPNGQGYGVNQQIILKPTAQFAVVLNWGAAQTLTGNTPIRIWMYGALYRAVV